jgi:hypothetical protein
MISMETIVALVVVFASPQRADFASLFPSCASVLPRGQT